MSSCWRLPMEMTDLKILAIDTSGKIASVAVSDGDRLLWEKTVFTKLTHSQVILPMVSSALEETGLDYPDIDCIAIAKGPGSYTGLRIGVGAVKGICMGCPTVKAAGVSTLMALAYNVMTFEGRIAAVMRARPKIIYGAIFDCCNGRITRLTEDRVCGEDEFFSQEEFSGRVILTGDCAHELKAARFAEDENILTAPMNSVLQRASSLCLAANDHPELMCEADKLEVSYLQATKAEKDKAHRDK